ncbi:hypothetical protein HDV01_006626 [Terramyces sp. JEL0728]|nr:hypothetical protein HDV01_006626 [Terramyces sp. JEL0728]
MKIPLLFLFSLVLAKKQVDLSKSNYGNYHESVKSFRKHNTETSGDEKDDVFYFFSLHDYNKGELDGHELGMALMGYELYDQEEMQNEYDLEDLEEMIDHAMDEDDKDGNGKISWAEYLESQV